jgi:hypothetical protein
MCESVCDWIEIRCWNSPLESQSMAPGFFSPSKTDCFSPFHLTLKAFPFLSFFIFSLQSSPTISFNNYTNNNRDANSHISFLLLPFTYLYYTFVENTITIYKIYIFTLFFLCFLWFSTISSKVWNFRQYPDRFFVF